MLAQCLLIATLLLGIHGAAPAVTVTGAVHIGNQTQTNVAGHIPGRDGGCVGSVGGKIMWFWSDTTWVTSPGNQFAGFWDNSGAYGNPSNPLQMTGPMSAGIPFTSEEAAFNQQNNNNPRVVLWPKSGVVEVTPGHGLMWVPRDYWGATGTGTETPGIVLCSVTVGSSGPNVTRLSNTPVFSGTVPPYGNLAATKDSQYVYLYSSSQIGAGDAYDHPTFIARAPLAQAQSVSAFEYYYANTNEWSTTPHNVNSNTGSIFTTATGLDGNVFYSATHNCWILIYQPDGSTVVNMMTAPAPQGPWSSSVTVYTSPKPSSPSVPYIYGTTATNLYDSTGKTAIVDYTYCTPTSYVNWVVELTFG